MAQSYELTVSFSLSGDALDPALATQLLGIQPSHAHVRGQPHAMGARPNRTYGNTVWVLESHLPAPTGLDEHLRILLDQLDSKAGALAKLRAMGCTVEFRCEVSGHQGDDGAAVWPDTLARIARLGATLRLTVSSADEGTAQEALPDGMEPQVVSFDTSLDPEALERFRVVLSVQRALLGEVSYALRGVSVESNEDEIRVRAFFHGTVSHDDEMTILGLESEIARDFPGRSVSSEPIRTDYPSPISSSGDWAYRRRER